MSAVVNRSTIGRSEQQVIDSVRRAREEEVRFFSCVARAERERWVVREFLERSGIEFAAEEIESQPENNIVDVIFRSARFQIKEICDPADRRHARVKQSARRAQLAASLKDLVEPVEARDIVFTDVTDLLFEIDASTAYSVSAKSDVDLLVYVTRPHAVFAELSQTVANKLKSLGWRSISCLFGQKPLFLVSTSQSPRFLCAKA